MSFDPDDEILQDFLVEAGEILELLGEQLVELEQNSDSADLLNAVFRGFHTIKGGAGFLNLTPLVELCHRAEDVFNLLRNGERAVDAKVMDVILPVLDSLNTMFDQINSGVEPDDADPEQLRALEAILAGDTAPAAAEPVAEAPPPAPEPEAPATPVEAAVETPATGADEDISDDEFEALLDALPDARNGAETTTPAETPAAEPVVAASDSASDDITDDEFEALLDELHGKGTGPATAQAETEVDNNAVTEKAPAQPAEAASDDITDDEFEALLDELHGKDDGPAVAKQDDVATSSEAAPASVEDKADASQPEANKEPQQAEAPKPAEAVPAAAAQPAEEQLAAAVAKQTAPAAAKPAEKTAAQPAATADKEQVKKVESTVRVDTSRLDDIMNLVGELVLVRNRLSTLQSSVEDEQICTAVGNLDVVTADLQMAVMKTRMQPIKKVFGRFPRVVRDLARSLKKEIKLEMLGEETDLDKNLVEALADPLVHLVRNAVDHGIEMPDDREAVGKPRSGTVLLSAEQEGDHIAITISDDGAGMDPDKLRQIAISKGVMDEESASRLSDHECYNLIFAPGFSTKTEISDISGRGVGMDVVKTRIVQLNGSVEIDSMKGKGSKLLIKVPLTLAIMPTLMVVLGKQIFALPLVNVSEIFDLDLRRTNIVDGKQVVIVRDKPLPLFYLSDWLTDSGQKSRESETGHVVIVGIGNKLVGFVVDELIGQEEVVIKPLSEMLQGTKGLAGATITGDGRIALILDVPSLLEAYAGKF